VVREDPAFAFDFGNVSGKVNISYTIQKEMLSVAMKDMVGKMDKPKIFAAAPEKPKPPVNVTTPAKPQQSVPACVDDGVCSSAEEALGCADCKKVEVAGIVNFPLVCGEIGVFILIIAAATLIWMRRKRTRQKYAA
jgi:hypothetical protein